MEAAVDPSHDPVPAGQMLAAERERQGMSRVEVAQRLHMSPTQVEALETGDYERLPKGPFLRGFVRNYAKILGLDADAVVAQLDQERPRTSAPGIVVPSQNIRFDPLGDRLSNPYVKAAGIAAVAIALGFAAMYWWLFIRPTPPAAHKAAEHVPPAAEPATPAITPPIAEPAMPPILQAPAVKSEPPRAEPAKTEAAKSDTTPKTPPAKAEPTKPAEASKAAAAATKNAPAAGDAVLKFHFDGESWVEVRDAKDKVLFQRLNPADSDATVTGKPPLRVIVGNAPEVTLRYNDRDFPLEPHTKVAVARFTLE